MYFRLEFRSPNNNHIITFFLKKNYPYYRELIRKAKYNIGSILETTIWMFSLCFSIISTAFFFHTLVPYKTVSLWLAGGLWHDNTLWKSLYSLWIAPSILWWLPWVEYVHVALVTWRTDLDSCEVSNTSLLNVEPFECNYEDGNVDMENDAG